MINDIIIWWNSMLISSSKCTRSVEMKHSLLKSKKIGHVFQWGETYLSKTREGQKALTCVYGFVYAGYFRQRKASKGCWSAYMYQWSHIVGVLNFFSAKALPAKSYRIVEFWIFLLVNSINNHVVYLNENLTGKNEAEAGFKYM